MYPRVPARAVTSATPASRQHATDNVSTGVEKLSTSTPRFTTQAPNLLAEKAQGTKLFAAFDDLQSCVAAWTARLARELATVETSKAAEQVEERQFADRKRSSPSRRHTQTAGEAVSLQQHGTPRYFAVLDVTAQWSSPSDQEVTRTSLSNTNNSTTPSTGVTSTASISTNKSAKSPTTSTSTPQWLIAEVEAFFQDKLALAIQARETELVNTMHECLQQELQEKERRVERERCRTAALEAQQKEFDKEKDHFQSKLDRRVAENNAMRKDFYKQLLMLRELVAKNRNDSRTLRALEEVMASVTTGKQEPRDGVSSPNDRPSAWADQHKKKLAQEPKGPSDPPGSSTSMRREKDKWEQRAREAVAANEHLQEQVLLLKQQLEEARGLDGELWFANAEHGLYERQRIIDCVYKSKCTWEQVGEAVVELLNNEMVWEAVEDSAYREKSRVSRGLEALLLRVEAVGGGRGSGARRSSNVEGPDEGIDEDVEGEDGTKRDSAKRRSAFSQASRMIACRTCNGCGYLDASAANGNQVEQEDDSYLRKTLAQVLELKTSLEEANNRTDEVEQQLLRTVMDGAHIKEKLEKIEHARAHSVDCCLQVDLDDEEEINVDDILHAYNSCESPDATNSTQRRGGRYKQYEHLIVELKNLLSERDAGMSQLRTAVSDVQARLVTVQRTSQQEQERLQRELQTLKGSLALAIKNRNETIEEKQAAVNVLLQNMERKKSQALSTKNFLLPRASVSEDDGTKSEVSASDVASDEEDDIEEEDDVIRSEIIARRYTQAISRVQLEHDEQQERLKQAEDELGQESDKRKRTSSISLGNIVVTMASHPRDLFKALSTAHQELLTLRRSSHRSSALQTDRLLTLTTHLAHISEELAMVKKRTIAEIDFWKLDCEKLQQANQALAMDLKKSQQLVEEANERAAEARAAKGNSSVQGCGICDKHEARLLEISSKLLAASSVEESDFPSDANRVSISTVSASSSALTDDERHGLSAILLDLENLYSTLSSTKQQHAKTVITKALVGQNSFSTQLNPSAVAAGFWPQHESADRTRRATAGAGVLPSQIDASVGLFRDGSRPPESWLASRRPNSPFRTASVPVDTETDTLRLQGSSISPTTSPLNRRKTIVRKVLTEQEIAQRQRARAYRSAPEHRASDQVFEPQVITEHAIVAEAREAGTVGERNDEYSSFINEEGKEVFYVDVEVEEEEEEVQAVAELESIRSAPVVHHSKGAQPSSEAAQASPTRPSEYTVQIPSPEHPAGGVMDEKIPSLQLVTSSDQIDKDPEVIQKLRDLVKYSMTAREVLALTNWTILICHLRASRDKKRLDYVNDVWRDAVANGRDQGSLTSLPHSVRTTMQKLVQYRELMLDAAIRQRDELRRATRRTQAQLIHGVSTVLTTLSRKNNLQFAAFDTLPFVHHDPETSPARQNSPHHSPLRPLYPSVRVNLSEIPGTQQVPTPSFPFSAPAPDQLSYHRVIQEKSPPRSARPRSSQSPHPADQATSSVFEHDNRFPQRSVKFVPAGDSEELSLTHSTSSLRVPTTSYSPSKSPSKAGLVVDVRRRPTHSAEATRPMYNIADADEIPRLAASLVPPIGLAQLEASLPVFRIPTRPQSSPAGMSSRVRLRPSSAQVTRDGGHSAAEVRPPERI